MGQLHREDGPAVTNWKGRAWFIENVSHTFDEWCEQLGKTEEEKFQLKLIYG